ncbi:B9 domain-containing protein 1 isoform X1 [Diachasma alloeum]|uniref:B9 domain-containing protein 1 isoform X1 n=1 Tax=Diachasma alloeum TaxID=454923 RepID=UPI0007382C2E|nr:B9 domain-containing protein 1 isoform X1 [Diachasma alloeum]
MSNGEFFVCATGSIEYGMFYEIDNAYCKYQYHFGDDWSIVAGIEEGITQMCKCTNDARRLAVWNFPLDVTFKSMNPYGWPQMVFSIYGLDVFGHDIVKGYGVCRLPLTSGRHEKETSIYVPESSSKLQQFAAWLTGRRPELIEPSILASGNGRELTRMRAQGSISVTFNIVLKDFHKLGYDNGERDK